MRLDHRDRITAARRILVRVSLTSVRMRRPSTARGCGRIVAGAVGSILVLAMVACASGTGTSVSTGWMGSAVFDVLHQDPVRAARLVFVGDTGTGNERASGVAAQIRRAAEAVPVSHVFLLGDNVYGFQGGRSIATRFLDVYRGVLSLGVRIHAALGNHDLDHCGDSGLRPVPRDESAYRASSRCSVDYQLATPDLGFPDGLRYYSIEISGEHPGWRRHEGGRQDSRQPDEPPLVEVFVLDTNTLGRKQTRLRRGLDESQLRWLADALERSDARWKVVAMHHPIYAPTRCWWFRFMCRNDDPTLRAQLEPVFRRHGVDVVFQAHQHLYARVRPIGGIRYFVTGAGGQKPDSFRDDERTVPRDDGGSFNHFMYIYATEDQFSYCVIDANGDLRDGGRFARGDATDRQDNPCSAPENAGSRPLVRPPQRDLPWTAPKPYPIPLR